MNQPRSWIAAIAIAAIVVAPKVVRADGENEIRAVTFDEDGATTRVHVAGAQTPTFTVYKLERPSRVVIDVPKARLGDALRGHEGAAQLAANTWAVSTVAAHQLDDGSQVVRVIITLARPAGYDVKLAGSELLVLVSARDPAPPATNPAALAAAQADREQARRAAQAAEQGRVQAERAAREAAAAQAVTKAEAQAAIDLARARAAAAETDAARVRAASQQDAETARQEAARSKADVEAARQEAARSKAEAEAARRDAEAAWAQAAADRRQAESARANARRMMREAAQQLAALEDKTRAAQAREDKARAASAAAEAREEAARAQVARAAADRAAAEAEARSAADAREPAAHPADAPRDPSIATAEAVESRLAAARAAIARAEQQRGAAESAASTARRNLEHTRAALAAVEQQRAAAESAASDAARKRAAAEAAASDAARRQHQAEIAADAARHQRAAAELARSEAVQRLGEAEQQRAAAEQQRLAAEQAARTARAAAEAADRQRAIAETAAQTAGEARRVAEAGIVELAARRAAAERAAVELEARSKAEATAQAQAQAVAAARSARQASAAEAARARAEVSRLADERKRAERELADRRAAVAAQQAETVRLRRAASQARDAADREESRRAQLAEQRAAEERALAAIQARRTAAQQVAAGAGAQVTSGAGAQVASGAGAQVSSGAGAQAASGAGAQVVSGAGAQAASGAGAQAAMSAPRSPRAAHPFGTVADRWVMSRSTPTARSTAATAVKVNARVDVDPARARACHSGRCSVDIPRAAPPGAAAASSTTAVTQPPTAPSTPALTATLTLTSTPGLTSPSTPASPRAAHPFGTVADRWAMSRSAPRSTLSARSTATSTTDKVTAPVNARPPGAVLAVAPPAATAAPSSTGAAPSTSAPSAPPAPIASPAEVRDISFSGDEATGQVAIAITGDVIVRAGAITATTAELILDHAQLATRLERKLDVSRFRGPVRAVSSFRDRRTPGRVRLIAELVSPATPSFDREPGAIRWSLVGADIARRPVTTRPASARAATVGGGFGAASTPIAQQSVAQVPPQAARRRVYHGQPMELHFKDAPIHDLLRLIADVGKVSIVVPDTIDAKVTLDLKRVPWDQALEVILSSHQLWYRREGNLYRIAPRKELDAEDEAEAARREAQLKAEAPRAQLVPLNYASASDLARKLEPMLSPHGKIAVDERTNQLIVTDVSGNRDQITRLAQSLDTQTPQISIEARIVEANSTFARQIGVQWGGRATASAAGGNATGLVFPSSISLIGGNEDSQTPRGGVATPSDFAINLPAATGTGEGGAIGLSLGSVGGNFNINLRLSALEDSGTIRIISAPKVTVLNNKQASIASGVSIPISTVSASGTQTQFVQADLRLDVVPTVSQSDCSITLALSVQKSEPNFAAVGARGDPSITRKEARTSMLVADGETSVLGGIYTRNTGLNYKKVPFFGDLPVLGWLFKFRRENDDRTEILVFITPKITNRALLRCR